MKATLPAPSYLHYPRGRACVDPKAYPDLEAFFADPSISRRADSPEEIATCGAVIMTPAERKMEAVWGVPGDHPWETFQL